MAHVGFENVLGVVERTEVSRPVGRIVALEDGRIIVGGLSRQAAMGDLVKITTPTGHARGEIVRIEGDRLTVLPDSPLDGLRIGLRVALLGAAVLAPDDSWIGRVIDPYGLPLDNRPLLPGTATRRLTGQPINPTERRGLGARLETGLCVFNTILPIIRGQRIGLFAGSGVGKSTILAMLAQRITADVVVIGMVGERGREVREFVERVLGPSGMARTVIVAATSDRSPGLRRRCASAAMTVAEHFRDQGRQVLLLADSITRFADAHREIALASGEAPSLRGYPPTTASAITTLCERAGPGAGAMGDITAIFTVLVAGSDMEEPVADILRGVLDGHVVLDRAIAERGRFPAIDVLRSVSRALPLAATPTENDQIAQARRLLGAYERAELMIQSGLYSSGSDPVIDAAILAWPKLDAFVAQRETEGIGASFEKLARCFPAQHKSAAAVNREADRLPVT
ncbi:FliI/YscN family ATPase [Oceaniglobus trochenteri]|uniref:FliI/YscN family ATPase n=1 Tax=Oceaniglobus trochenteri TaxID=2763260 RepID=UPI001CFFF254|nr:FliI/YscN family ATPase [Oceaniglobus trochenteri]